MKAIIETSRLILRQWKSEDALPFYQLNSDPQVMRYFPECLTRERSDAVIDRLTSMIDENGWGFWAVERKDNAEFIGFVGLLAQPEQSDIPFTPFVEIGWRLSRSSWGMGFATEAAQGALSYAFCHLGVDAVYSFTVLENLPSRKVMERIGMQNTGRDFNHPKLEAGHPLERHCLYKISLTDWKELTGGKA